MHVLLLIPYNKYMLLFYLFLWSLFQRIVTSETSRLNSQLGPLSPILTVAGNIMLLLISWAPETRVLLFWLVQQSVSATHLHNMLPSIFIVHLCVATGNRNHFGMWLVSVIGCASCNDCCICTLLFCCCGWN